MSHQLLGRHHDDTRRPAARTSPNGTGRRAGPAPGGRDVAVAGGLIALTGVVFWLVAGGVLALLTPWIAP
jgi:hypothetical protein